MIELPSASVSLPAASCRWCGKIRLLVLPGLPPPSVAEYFEKVTLHEAECPHRPQADA